MDLKAGGTGGAECGMLKLARANLVGMLPDSALFRMIDANFLATAKDLESKPPTPSPRFSFPFTQSMSGIFFSVHPPLIR